MKTSEIISEFLAFLRQAVTDCDCASSMKRQANEQTQDIMHKLELYKCSYHERAKLATLLVNVRQNRRALKNTYEVLHPISEWMLINGHVYHSLERLLGEVRKAEEKQQNRIYLPRTSIVDFPKEDSTDDT